MAEIIAAVPSARPSEYRCFGNRQAIWSSVRRSLDIALAAAATHVNAPLQSNVADNTVCNRTIEPPPSESFLVALFSGYEIIINVFIA